MNTRLTKLIFICLLLGSCERHQDNIVQYVDGKQLLNMNTLSWNGKVIDSVNLRVAVIDTIKSGEELHAQVFLEKDGYKIVDAFYNCSVSERSLVDTLSKRIEGCRDGLVVEDDTVEIFLVVGNSGGWKQFHEITILSVDSNRVYRFHNGTFKYFVK